VLWAKAVRTGRTIQKRVKRGLNENDEEADEGSVIDDTNRNFAKM
jgi:hypothetical protein